MAFWTEVWAIVAALIIVDVAKWVIGSACLAAAVRYLIKRIES